MSLDGGGVGVFILISFFPHLVPNDFFDWSCSQEALCLPLREVEKVMCAELKTQREADLRG